MARIYKTYLKIDIARGMLDTAIQLYINGGDRFSVMHLASAAEEVLGGLIKQRRDRHPPSQTDKTAREQWIASLSLAYQMRGIQRSEKEISDVMNFARNHTKHHDTNNADVIAVEVEGEAHDALFRAIDNYGRYTGVFTEPMIEFSNYHPVA